MAFVKFLDTGAIYQATVIPVSSTVVKISYDTGELYENTSGFVFSSREDFKLILGRYENYKTVYKKEDNELYLSKDGSIYPEVTKESTPTLKERVISLEDENANLKQQLTDAQMALCDIYEMVSVR